MAKKKTALPKNFNELIENGDITALKAVFDKCELDARSGYAKETALSFFGIPEELIRWLMGQGADINAADKYGKTALHKHASYWNGTPRVQLLIELGADIKASDDKGYTPLHSAAETFKSENVRILIQNGADISAKGGYSKQTSFMTALSSCHNANITDMLDITQKAQVFEDEEIRKLIMETKDPKQMKSLGRKVKNFDEEIWDNLKYSIVLNGNYQKFAQNNEMREKLLATDNKVLVEASPFDTIWGIGYSEENHSAANPKDWRGLNLLGFALMEVRDEIKTVYQNYDKINWRQFEEYN